ncbi:MAG: hypothetical protein ACKVOR_01835 [Flavobacteriales bacterium]
MKYDPEDIESLLRHKQFSELYPEEKEFVLRHVEGQDEYESLRQTLGLMHDLRQHDQWLEPDPVIKHNLLREFATEEKGGFTVWLNSLFAMPQLPEIVWYRRPAVRYAFASLLLLCGVGVGIWTMSKKDNIGNDIASTQTTEKNEVPTDTEKQMQQKPAYAENNQPGVFPPAPKPVEVFVESNLEEATDESVPPPVVEQIKFVAPVATDEAPAMEKADNDGASTLVSKDTKVSADDVTLDMTTMEEEENEKALIEDVQNKIAEDKATAFKKPEALDRDADSYKVKSADLPQNTFNNLTLSDNTAPVLNSGTPAYTWTPSTTNEVVTISTIQGSNTYRLANTANAAQVKDVLDLLYTAR